MCGIVGIAFRNARREAPSAGLQSALQAIRHRGPDDGGAFSAPGVVLGSRRLAILDLSSAGHMPMSTPDGRYHITYNGEVYNYRELRADLETRGHTFRSNTDTEVILAAFAERGPAMLSSLNGMFAFAIWDTAERSLFIARDRLGVKPLYFAETADGLVFGSEQKALFAMGVPRRFDHSKWEELLCFRYVGGAETTFVGVQRLLPGHWLQYREGKAAIRRWWTLAERARELREKSPVDPVAWYRQSLLDSIAYRRISDVPVGVLLSGGMDSSSVAAGLAMQAGTGVASFTVRFHERGYDEGDLAKLVAVRWSLEYHDLFVKPECLLDALSQASRFNDDPLAHGSDLHLLAIARHARPSVTVLLSGEGADETLGGYVRYRPLQFPAILAAGRPLARFAPWRVSRGRLTKLARFLRLGTLEQFVLFNACDVLPQDLSAVGLTPTCTYPFRESVLAEARALYADDLTRQAMYLDQHTFLCSLLDRNDRMTMGASIECRVPFLDYRLVEGLASLPSRVLLNARQPKSLLHRAMDTTLPRSLRHGRKWGFGVPWDTYMRGVPAVTDRLATIADSPLIAESPLDRACVAALVEDYLRGDRTHARLVKQLFMLVVWHNAYFRSQTAPDAAYAASAPTYVH